MPLFGNKPGSKQFKVKLVSGRVLGPLDLSRVQKLIKKNQITGQEQACCLPEGEWKDINQIPELAELLLRRLEKQLDPSQKTQTHTASPEAQPADPMAATVRLGVTQVLPGAEPQEKSGQSLGELPELNTRALADAGVNLPPDPQDTRNIPPQPKTDLVLPLPEGRPEFQDFKPAEETVEKTVIATPEEEDSIEKTVIGEIEEETSQPEPTHSRMLQPLSSTVADQPTIVFQQSPYSPAPPGASSPASQVKSGKSGESALKKGLVALLLVLVLHDLLFPEEEKKPEFATVTKIRPILPNVQKSQINPQRSEEIFKSGLPFYLEDTVQGYKQAARRFLMASSLDDQNVKALALLASSYLNLIDSSNKDEKYFSTLSSLIEMSRAKSIDLAETVIADVEFYIVANKAEAAQNRIIEYTKSHKFGLEMFYYLSYVFYHRGDYASAARYIGQIPDNKVFSAKIFFLRGQIAEKLGSDPEAAAEYQKAIAFGKRNHARSYLALVRLLDRKGRLNDGGAYLEFLVKNFRLLPAHELAEAYYLRSKYHSILERWDVALGDIEKSVKLEPKSHDYRLELYTLRARVGAKVESVRDQARMYYFLGEGEKLLKEGKYEDALAQFMQARQVDPKSYIPLEKAGDSFRMMNNIENARSNYEKAARLSKNNIEVWSKYIETLIQSFDWIETRKAMDRFMLIPESRSAIDKLSGDMYLKQGMPREALAYYQKAMSHSRIDPGVYVAYAKSLMASGNFKDAPFFFALARRFDPLNMEAIVGTAKCIAETESIARAVSFLGDELQKSGGSRAELLVAAAELEIKRGNWVQAQAMVSQAMAANPTLAAPWKIQAEIHMHQAGAEKPIQEKDKKALERAMDAYKSYSDRNPSDPSGYLERFQLFIQQSKFERAEEELTRIYTLYPKYPNLHFYRGNLYNAMGNYKVAIDEFTTEIKNHPNNVAALMAMGRALIEVGAPQKAITHLSRAMVLSPTYGEAKHLSGYANYLMKNQQGAIALYKSALQYDRGNPVIYKRLGLAYLEIGDRPAASEAFRQYLQLAPDAPDRDVYEKYL